MPLSTSVPGSEEPAPDANAAIKSAPGQPPASSKVGHHSRRLAIGTLAQQVSQAVSVVTMLAMTTVLARTLSLAEFGTYGLTLSLSTYLTFALGSMEPAAIRAVAGAKGRDANDRAFTTIVLLYVSIALAAAILISGVGPLILGIFHIPAGLHRQARLGLIAIGAATLLGWPTKAFPDVMRGNQRYPLVAASEVIGYMLLTAVFMILVFVVHAPLWALIGIGACVPLVTGTGAALIFFTLRWSYRFRLRTVQLRYMRDFARTSLYMMSLSATDLVVYQSDRTVLALFRSASTIGLYEAVVRPHNIIRQFRASLSLTVLPASSAYIAEKDHARLRQLLLQGSRYTLAAVVPVTLVVMVLAREILYVWIGPKFEPAATALTIMISYWLFMSGISLMSSMLIATRRIGSLAAYTWGTAILNLGLSLALTPWLGLDGVILGTVLAYAIFAPLLVRLALTRFGVSLSDLLRQSAWPAYSLGIALVGILFALRVVLDLDSIVPLALVCIGSILGYWVAFYSIWMRPQEQALVRDLAASATSVLRRRRR